MAKPKIPKISFKGKRKKIITIVLVVVLLGGALAAGMLLGWWQNGGTNDGGNGTSVSNGESDGFTENSLPEAVKRAQDTAAVSSPEESNKQIATELPGADSSLKFELLLQQGVNYENAGDYQSALNSYKEAEKLQQTSNVYESLGRVEEALGDKTAAIDYYKKAVSLMNQDSPMYSSDKKRLEDKITELGG